MRRHADMIEKKVLQGKFALVAGGSSGIGLASAAALLKSGAHVTITGRNPSKLKSAAEWLISSVGADISVLEWKICDAYDERQVQSVVEDFRELHARLDIAVAVAGGEGHGGPIHLMQKDQFEQTISFGVLPTFLLLKHAAPLMIESGGGSLIVVSSIVATMTSPFIGAYSAGKAALEAMMRAAADELGRHNVRVNAVRPGYTPGLSDAKERNLNNYSAAYIDQQALKELGSAEYVAETVRFLAGPESNWITGQCLNVDGGISLHRIPQWTHVAAGGLPVSEDWKNFNG